MLFAKQSTAKTLNVGPALDSAGAEYTGLVIGDLTIDKAGTNAAMAAAATLTHVSNGHYDLVMTTGNTDTLGTIQIRCNKATYQVPTLELMVLPATVYDALVTNAAGGANGLLLSLASNQVDVGKLLGTAWLTPVTAGTPDVNTKLWNGLTTVALPLIPATAGRTLVVDAAGLADANMVKAGPTGAGTAQTAGDIPALINTVDDLLDTEVAAIKTKTDFLPSATAGAAGGLFIAGTNAPVTITGSGDALTLTSTGTNGSGIKATGQGTGHGMSLLSGTGATGNGLNAAAQSTAGNGLYGLGTTSGDGMHAQGGTTGRGYHGVGGPTSGAGMRMEAGMNDDGVEFVHHGTGVDIDATTSNLPFATQTSVNTIDDFLDTEIAAIKAVTDAITTTGTGLSAIPWNAAWDAEVQSEVDDALKAALTEGYRGTNATGSVRDLLYEVIAHLGESAISSTTKTLKKIDGTTAKTYTLDSASAPTSITETS